MSRQPHRQLQTDTDTDSTIVWEMVQNQYHQYWISCEFIVLNFSKIEPISSICFPYLMYPLQNIIIPKTKVANIDNTFIAINKTDIF